MFSRSRLELYRPEDTTERARKGKPGPPERILRMENLLLSRLRKRKAHKKEGLMFGLFSCGLLSKMFHSS